MKKPGQKGTELFTPERVACVWLPQFAVWAERARDPELMQRPVVLVGRAERGETNVVRVCSSEAIGLSPGMPAQSIPQRCPSAVLLPFDERHYERRYQRLLAGLDCITPEIEACPLEVFYLNLTGLPYPDGEEAEQVATAVREIIPLPFPTRIGVASGRFTAWVAANCATAVRPLCISDDEKPVFLQDAPSALLPVRSETARRLDVMGLRTLGRIARLARSSMLAQFGREGERAHRLASGDDREPLDLYVAVTTVRETLEFPMPAPTVAHFDVALGQLLERVCARPERQGRGIRQVRLSAQMEEGHIWDRTLTLRRPHEEWRRVYEELRRRLEPMRPVGALLELSVELTAFAERLDVQPLLFPDEKQHRRERLVNELSQLWERTGRSSVFRIVEVEPWSRLPERRHALVSSDT
jgi:nucleotidyltransferase/DNA polymerase involved in DNA repair